MSISSIEELIYSIKKDVHLHASRLRLKNARKNLEKLIRLLKRPGFRGFDDPLHAFEDPLTAFEDPLTAFDNFYRRRNKKTLQHFIEVLEHYESSLIS
jgi:hypothetical protein